MSISAISSANHAAPLPESEKVALSPVPSQSSSASLPNDTVTLSSAAQKASQPVDVDHDGDSH